jgi:elongator complex protein 4
MSFRKRSVGLLPVHGTSTNTTRAPAPSIPGTRASPLDGRLTTSTGTPSLDALFGGHGGQPTGTLVLLEERGTTDFAGALLRFYAAEGVVQKHAVHVAAVSEGWAKELPGVTGALEDGEEDKGEQKEKEKMKIAWRYERLGEFGKGGGLKGEFEEKLIVHLNL